jgi:hypothetical protein
MNFWAILAAWGVPSTLAATIIGIMFRRIEKRMDERRKFEQFQVKGLMATMKLGEANAIALQNGRCNGETHAALDYVKNIKRQERDFLMAQGIEHIF